MKHQAFNIVQTVVLVLYTRSWFDLLLTDMNVSICFTESQIGYSMTPFSSLRYMSKTQHGS